MKTIKELRDELGQVDYGTTHERRIHEILTGIVDHLERLERSGDILDQRITDVQYNCGSGSRNP